MLLSKVLENLDSAKKLHLPGHRNTRENDTEIKVFLKEAVANWLHERHIEAHVYIEDLNGYPYRKYINFDSIGVHNNYNAVVKKNSWVNKLIIQAKYLNGTRSNNYASIFQNWYVRTHKVTTDAKFLAPFDQEFLHFVEEMDQYLRKQD